MTAPDGVEVGRVRTNGIELSVARAGPRAGPPVLLLHGFPECAYGWREQIGFLAGRGHRVWAPDLRGYGRSDRPAGRAAYRMSELLKDVLGLIDAGGWARVAVVGHDWGGAVAWRLAEWFPERVERLVVVNCPHPAVLGRALGRSPAQLLRSAYILLFQLPWLPERVLGAHGAQALARALRHTSAPGAIGEAELRRYREDWTRPGALTGMLNWYRAAARGGGRPPGGGEGGKIRAPTLLVWGTGDRFLGEELIEPSLARCADARLARLEGVSHWVPWEAPERLNPLLAGFLEG